MLKLGLKVLANTALAKVEGLPFQVEGEISEAFENDIGPYLVRTTRPLTPIKTGYLRSTEGYIVQPGRGIRGLIFGAGASYAGVVEQRKPYLRPGLANAEPYIERKVQEAVTRALLK
jgi:hypothetical protein